MFKWHNPKNLSLLYFHYHHHVIIITIIIVIILIFIVIIIIIILIIIIIIIIIIIMKQNIRQYAPRGHRPLNCSYDKKKSRQKVTVWVGLVGNGMLICVSVHVHVCVCVCLCVFVCLASRIIKKNWLSLFKTLFYSSPSNLAQVTPGSLVKIVRCSVMHAEI